jgi:hypothetical protein
MREPAITLIKENSWHLYINDKTADHKLFKPPTIINKITGLHQMAGQRVKVTIGKFWIYYSEQPTNHKSLNMYSTSSKRKNLFLPQSNQYIRTVPGIGNSLRFEMVSISQHLFGIS